jgi:hypothetical protein
VPRAINPSRKKERVNASPLERATIVLSRSKNAHSMYEHCDAGHRLASTDVEGCGRAE